MAAPSPLHEQIVASVKELSEQDKQEVLDVVEFLRIREHREFLEYVKMRTDAAKRARERGEHFTSLEELQQEYA